jgi:hypothetical protein
MMAALFQIMAAFLRDSLTFRECVPSWKNGDHMLRAHVQEKSLSMMFVMHHEHGHHRILID